MPEFEFIVRVTADSPYVTREDAESVMDAIIESGDYCPPWMALPPRAVEVEVGDGQYADAYCEVEIR